MMRVAPAISVLVPAYRDGVYLATSLRSLMAQSFSDFEVIVCDDASDDDTGERAQQIASGDERIRVVLHRQNLGMTGNWNRALSYARGHYVMKLDADDALQPLALERLHAAAQDGGAVVFCRTRECDESLCPSGPYRGEAALTKGGLDPEQAYSHPGHFWYELCFDDYQLWHSNAFLMARSLLQRLGGWDENYGCAADTDIILRVLELGVTVIHEPYVGVLYRMRAGSVSDRFRRQGRLLEEAIRLHLASLHRSWIAGRPLSSHLRQQWWRYWHMRKHLPAHDRPAIGMRPPLNIWWPRQLRYVAHCLLSGRSA